MMQMQQRYYDDPIFHSLVDMLVAQIEHGNLTPTETREAAMLAQIIYEKRNPTRPTTFTSSEVNRGLV